MRIAIYGSNGHQIHRRLENHPLARLVATAAFPRDELPEALRNDASIRHVQCLEDLLADPEVDLICLCSPRRGMQARDAILALNAGKHVYAEKPCATSECDLDAILSAAAASGCQFREMAGTGLEAPYLAIRNLIGEGLLGEVVHVAAGKSYPNHDKRPQDEGIDGGLIAQCAVHAFRMVEHVARTRIRSLQAVESILGNTTPGGGLRMAASVLCQLENGGVATISANYLNPPGTGSWNYDSLRIFGTRGMVEASGAGTRLVIGEKDLGNIPHADVSIDHLDAYLEALSGGATMLLDLEEELRPTRWALRAKAAALLNHP